MKRRHYTDICSNSIWDSTIDVLGWRQRLLRSGAAGAGRSDRRWDVAKSAKENQQLTKAPDANHALFRDLSADGSAQFCYQRAFFAELDAEEKRDLVHRYNGQQEMDKLHLKSKSTKIAEVSFMTWFAREKWGEPRPDDLLNFSAKLLAQKGAG